MTEEFGKLEHILIHANKTNTKIEPIIGGLEKFVNNWSTKTKRKPMPNNQAHRYDCANARRL